MTQRDRHDREADDLLAAIASLADGELDADCLALRLDQYERCALGAYCPEVAFDPVARRLVDLASSLRATAPSLAWGRWARRVRALVASLRGAALHNTARVARPASQPAPANPANPRRRPGTAVAMGVPAPAEHRRRARRTAMNETTQRILTAIQGDHDAICALAGAIARSDAGAVRAQLAARGVALDAAEAEAVVRGAAAQGAAAMTNTNTNTNT
ncbi:MAG: hypothetical protein U0324_26190 [Polyangiales bacterium]